MKRVILACRSETVSMRIRRVLSDGGIAVSGACFSGASALALARKWGEGILISTRLADLPAAELARLLPSRFDLIALLDSGQVFPPHHSNAVVLHLPVNRADLLSTVSMLMATASTAHRGTGRTQEDARRIADAKAVLMERHHLSECDAHRLLQRRSMDAGIGMAELARWILSEP